ncbi:hypothetical protein [Geomicrobium sp. JCM 19039]|uniref:hypothetical protein n=1 Tax=Geomicrobium sp. JCM 19039 TaxID=1460636 RepID=UPI001EE659DA|nr:hypothetical protein [Geomicrobium sp. JCM 19039]
MAVPAIASVGCSYAETLEEDRIEINELSEEVKFELREASETVYDEFVNSVEGAEDMLQLFD